MARLWPGSTLAWFRLIHFTNKSVSMLLSVCASLWSVFFFFFFVKPVMNVPIDGFLFQQAVQERKEKVPSIVVLWAIMLCARCELIQSQSVKQICTHLHFNDVKCGETMYTHQPGGFERHRDRQSNHTVQTLNIHMFHCWHEGKCFSFANGTRPATWCTSAFNLALG